MTIYFPIKNLKGKELAATYFYTDHRSPYAVYSDEEKANKISLDLKVKFTSKVYYNLENFLYLCCKYVDLENVKEDIIIIKIINNKTIKLTYLNFIMPYLIFIILLL